MVQAHLDDSPEAIVGLLSNIKDTANDEWPADMPDELKNELLLAEFICQSYEELSLIPIESVFETSIKAVNNMTAKDNSM